MNVTEMCEFRRVRDDDGWLAIASNSDYDETILGSRFSMYRGRELLIDSLHRLVHMHCASCAQKSAGGLRIGHQQQRRVESFLMAIGL